MFSLYDMKCDLERLDKWDFYAVEQALRAGEVSSADFDFLRRAIDTILNMANDADALLEALDEIEHADDDWGDK